MNGKKSWVDFLINPQSVLQLYQSVPMLDGVLVKKLILSSYGTDMRIIIDLNRLPAKPPVRWRDVEYDVVEITIDFFDIQDLKMDGWSREDRSSLHFSESGTMTNVSILSKHSNLKFLAQFIRVVSFEPYLLSKDI